MKYMIKEVSQDMVHDCDIEFPYIAVDENGMDEKGEAMEYSEAILLARELNGIKLIKDLPIQVINAIGDYVDQGVNDDEAWESFLNDEIENVKKFCVEANAGVDAFKVFNNTDDFYASDDTFTFDEVIDFVTEFPKRYIRQEGIYHSNHGKIPADEVRLEMMGTDLEETEDYPHYIN